MRQLIEDLRVVNYCDYERGFADAPYFFKDCIFEVEEACTFANATPVAPTDSNGARDHQIDPPNVFKRSFQPPPVFHDLFAADCRAPYVLVEDGWIELIEAVGERRRRHYDGLPVFQSIKPDVVLSGVRRHEYPLSIFVNVKRTQERGGCLLPRKRRNFVKRVRDAQLLHPLPNFRPHLLLAPRWVHNITSEPFCSNWRRFDLRLNAKRLSLFSHFEL
ncbi:MAG: hypothetical protein OD814_001564, partial [Candidatus Alkanophagales archaeon MCA70_species_1]|nr:hypothetical protein [Candidatus Alkanophaga volatiphilum]